MARWLRKIRTLLPQQIHAPLAVIYEKFATPGLNQFYQQVACEISSVTSGCVLDVGTGPGHLLVELARLSPGLELVGLDLSRKMLSMAKTLIEQDTGQSVSIAATDLLPNTVETDTCSKSIRLVRGDVRDIPFADGAC